MGRRGRCRCRCRGGSGRPIGRLGAVVAGFVGAPPRRSGALRRPKRDWGEWELYRRGRWRDRCATVPPSAVVAEAAARARAPEGSARRRVRTRAGNFAGQKAEARRDGRRARERRQGGRSGRKKSAQGRKKRAEALGLRPGQTFCFWKQLRTSDRWSASKSGERTN